jgi:hypothetical protein
LQSTLNNFKKLSQAKEGPWLPRNSDRNVASLEPDLKLNVASIDPSISSSPRIPLDLEKSVQNATEDAVDTVVHDALEATYRSPWLVKILKSQLSPTVSNISEHPLFQLPLDGSLPDEIVSRVDASISTKPMAVINAFLHVDTGATCFVTNNQHELHCPVPTQATCGTAQSGPRTTINALDTLILDLVTSDGLTIPIEAHQTPGMKNFTVVP